MTRIRSNYRLVLGIVSVNLVLFELLSFAGIYAIGVIRPDRRLDLFVESLFEDVTDANVREYLAGSYDQDLGWDVRPPSGPTFINVDSESVDNLETIFSNSVPDTS